MDFSLPSFWEKKLQAAICSRVVAFVERKRSEKSYQKVVSLLWVHFLTLSLFYLDKH